jgi:hypothetical protein
VGNQADAAASLGDLVYGGGQGRSFKVDRLRSSGMALGWQDSNLESFDRKENINHLNSVYSYYIHTEA